MWLLKGGVALEYRTERSRATLDIDLSTQALPDAAFAAVAQSESIRMEDYFAIRVGERSRPDGDIQTERFAVTVTYENGKPFEKIKLDIGFADPFIAPAESLTAPDLLGFADIEPVRIASIPLPQHFAEKLHAYTRVYGGTRTSSRVKDLVDMYLMVDELTFDDAAFMRVASQVFDTRATHPVPRTLPAPPNGWAVPFREQTEELGIEQDMHRAHASLARRLDPLLESIAGR